MSRRRPEYSRDSRRYHDWLDRAGEDILAAGALSRNDRCYNAAAFHCQQAIEKALKAYILLKSGELADGHNLPWLCKRAMRYDSRFTEWLDESASLNKCYIETRYPADLAPGLDYGRVTVYYSMAKAMYRFICEEVDATLESNTALP